MENCQFVFRYISWQIVLFRTLRQDDRSLTLMSIIGYLGALRHMILKHFFPEKTYQYSNKSALSGTFPVDIEFTILLSEKY